jgi:hypothetical protein
LIRFPVFIENKKARFPPGVTTAVGDSSKFPAVVTPVYINGQVLCTWFEVEKKEEEEEEEKKIRLWWGGSSSSRTLDLL